MNHRNACMALILVCALLQACKDSNEETEPSAGVDRLERQLELRHHADLLAVITASGSTLAEFTTDGCSGGLSIGWEYLAEEIEDVRNYHGFRPPWEDCCIEHDRLYHAGAAIGATAEESFEARKQADLALMACVVETGNTRVEELTSEYGVSPGTVQTLYAAIAELMYRAVRLGGVPCSGLPWRWGYGWPKCG
jgi:hypothetical protein